jgi:hypothetical protein
MNDHTRSTPKALREVASKLPGKPVFYTGHGGNKRQVGEVIAAQTGYDAAFVRIEIWDRELRSLIDSPSAGALDVEFVL